MKRKKKLIVIFVSIISIIIVICGITYISSSNRHIHVLLKYPGTSQDYSKLRDYWIENDNVYMQCQLVIDNGNDKDVSIRLWATSYIDVIFGLLNNPFLFGYDKENNSDVITIPANTRIEFKEIVFIGKKGMGDTKFSRELPNIHIIVINTE